MLDPRIYRTGLMVVVVAVIVVAFSLGNQASPLSATLVPDAFNGDTAYGMMRSLARQYPNRQAGSPADRALADYVARSMNSDGFVVQRQVFQAQTVDGSRTIENVIGTLAGSTPGTIVVVAHRDAPRPGSAADMSGTAVLLELAQVLSHQTQQRSVVLASTSAQVGAAGAAQLAGNLPGPVDAVIVLGDMAGLNVGSTVVVPWSDSQLVADPLLRNTVSTALSEQTGLGARDESLGGQFLHLAFPLAASEQRPFATVGLSAVLVSASGARLPAPDEPTIPGQIGGFGRTVLQAVTALQSGPTVPGPSSYLRWQGKLIPAWAVRLLVLALIAPVLCATIDGLARVRRRGQRVGRWILWVLSACLPFVLAVLAILVLHAAGAIDAPPGPVGGDAMTLGGRAAGVLAGLACLIAGGFALRWWLGRHLWASTSVSPPARPENGRAHSRRAARQAVPDDPAAPGAAAALLLVLCVIALVLWLANPFAAALLVPALHLWLWIVAPEQRLRAPWAVLLFLAGLVPGALALFYYAAALGLGAAPAAWNAVLMLAGGSMSVMRAIEWSVVLGCVVSLATMIVRITRQPRVDPPAGPITVRGPITYAGPGSLGGTKSALRR